MRREKPDSPPINKKPYYLSSMQRYAESQKLHSFEVDESKKEAEKNQLVSEVGHQTSVMFTV